MKEADKATGLLELSITGLVFIFAPRVVSRIYLDVVSNGRKIV